MRLANRIHSSGRAVVWSGQKEQAELYWEQLQGPRADDGSARTAVTARGRFRRVLSGSRRGEDRARRPRAGLLIVFAVLSSLLLPAAQSHYPGNRLGLFIVVAVGPLRGDDGRRLRFRARRRRAPAPRRPRRDGDGDRGGARDDDRRARRRGRGRSGGRRGRLRLGGLRGLPHARGGRLVRQRRAEPRRGASRDAALVVDRVTNGHGRDAVVQGQLAEQQIQDVAAYVVASTQG